MRAHRDQAATGTAAASPEGDAVIAGHRVVRLLGTGDRAVVYLGHSRAGSAVALKVFRVDTAPATIELDIAVLTSAAAPGLVRLLDVAQLGDGRICLVLERLAGGSLARYLVEYPRLSAGEAVTVLAPITVALDAMHMSGFAHGSVSQATILLDARGRAVLTGFGAVQQLSDALRERTPLLQADYSRLGNVMQAVCDGLEESDSDRGSGVALLREFQASVMPTVHQPAAGPASAGAYPPAGPASAGAYPPSVLAGLEHKLFDWADARPLRGFQTAPRQDLTLLGEHILAGAPTARHVDGVQVRPGLFGDGKPPGDIRQSPVDVSRPGHDQTEADRTEPARAAGEVHPDGAVAENVVEESATEFGNQFADEFADEFADDMPDDVAAKLPRAPWDRIGAVFRTISRRSAPRGQARGPRGLLARAIENAADCHPVQTAGHALRKRLHGRERPILVAALGCVSILVLVLTLFPLSGRAGEERRAGQSGDSGTVRTTGIPPATPAADSLSEENSDENQSSPAQADTESSRLAAIAGDDPVAAVVALLARRAICLADRSLVCLVGVDQTGSAVLALDSYDARDRQQGGPGRALPDYQGYLPSLAERSGDLAVVALAPAHGQERSQPASVLVVKGESGWRLREIFDY